MVLNLKDYMSSKEAADYLGITQNTIRAWDKRGILTPSRHPGNGYRLYLKEQLDELLNNLNKDK